MNRVTGRARALAVAGALLAAGCGVEGEDRARSIGPDDVPFRLLDAEATPVVPTTRPPPPVGLVDACYFDGGRLVTVAVPAGADARPGPLGAVDALVTAPVIDSDALQTAVPPEAGITNVEVSGGIARVTLDPDFSQLVAAGEQLRYIAQIVCTLTAQPGIGQVSFTLAGESLQVPTGTGTLASGPVAREDYAPLLADPEPDPEPPAG